MNKRKPKFRKKKVNLTTLQRGVDKFMREHPIYGEDYKREKSIKKIIRGFVT